MPVFFAKGQHVLIQLESDDDWMSFYNSCDGYITPQSFQLIRDYLKQSAKTVVVEKGYMDVDYRDTYFNFFPGNLPSIQARLSGQIFSWIKYLPGCCLSLIIIKMRISVLLC